MNKYAGEKNIKSFFEFLSTDTNLKCKPMSDGKIEIIKNTFPDKKIPQSYIYFLKVAGDYFELWNGSDYILVNNEGHFIDLSSYVKKDNALNLLFKKYGFSYDNCMFFWSHQGNTYSFFRLNDKDKPTVYILDANIEQEKLVETTFAGFLIDTYNSYVSAHEMLDNPWRKCRINMAERIIQDVMNKFYEKDNITVSIPYAFDKYMINPMNNSSFDFMISLNPILEECITNINSVYVYSHGIVYLYFPKKNSACNNTINFDLYYDNNFIMDREYTWGWIVKGKHVFVFGDKFRTLVRQNIPRLINISNE